MNQPIAHWAPANGSSTYFNLTAASGPMEIWEDSEAKKNVENVLTRDTVRALFELADDGHFDVLHGFIKDGKESKVAVATKDDRTVAVKIYTIKASRYDNMQRYLIGDPRFENIKRNKRSIIHNWCAKEFKNLHKAREAGLTTPEPIAFNKNVLVMEFLGEQYRPAPRLHEMGLENPDEALDLILDDAKKLWQTEKLVHGDLSAFNILVWDNKLWWIDFSQAVLSAHPEARELLERDIKNVLMHFEKHYELTRDVDDVVTDIAGEKGF